MPVIAQLNYAATSVSLMLKTRYTNRTMLGHMCRGQLEETVELQPTFVVKLSA